MELLAEGPLLLRPHLVHLPQPLVHLRQRLVDRLDKGAHGLLPILQLGPRLGLQRLEGTLRHLHERRGVPLESLLGEGLERVFSDACASPKSASFCPVPHAELSWSNLPQIALRP